jgi:hypothetical protein
MLLIHPPVAKPSEPPAGLARMAGALNRHRLSHRIIDANLEVLFHRLQGRTDRTDRWTQRARRHLKVNLDSLWSGKAFGHPDQYIRAVNDINRVFQTVRPCPQAPLTLVNYADPALSPLRSRDLLRSAEHPEENPFFDWFSLGLTGLLEKVKPSLIGLSVNYLSQALSALALAGFLRQRAPGVKIVLGGGLITSWLAKPGRGNPFQGLIDELIAGPGEGPLLRGRGILPTEDHYTPDYQAFSGRPYLSPGFILPYSASAGCYWQGCTFCPERAEGGPYRPVPPERVSADLMRLINDTRPVLVHLLDNALSPALLRHLAQNPLPVPWYGFVRFSKELADPGFCLALKRSGCILLKLGLESGDQGVLDSLGKGVELETASKVLKNLKAAGIAAYVYLLFGTPAEDLASARRTLDFVAGHSREIGFLNLAIFNMPVYGPEADLLETEDFYEGDLSLYRQFRHPRGWNRGDVRRFLDREFKRHPAVAAILRRDPPLFTSNHAPFFQL